MVAKRIKDVQRTMILEASDLEATVSHLEEFTSAQQDLRKYERQVASRSARVLADLEGVARTREKLRSQLASLRSIDLDSPQPQDEDGEVDDLLERMESLLSGDE